MLTGSTRKEMFVGVDGKYNEGMFVGVDGKYNEGMFVGVDGKYNEGMREFANYLLFGLFEEKRQNELVKYVLFLAYVLFNSLA